MTEQESPPGRARLADWLRPGLLYERILLGPTFVAPTLVLVLCAALYSQLADWRIEVAGKQLDALAREVARLVEAARA